MAEELLRASGAGLVGNAVRASGVELKDSGAAKATEQADHNRKVEAAVANAKLDTQSDLLRRILQALDRGKPSAVLDL